jgi:hypothetical protein
MRESKGIDMATRRALRALDLAEIETRLAQTDRDLASRYPGEPGSRQPVHTVYVPGDRFTADTVADWGARARSALREHAPTAAELAEATGVEQSAVDAVYGALVAKLTDEPIEDLRVDFEDGYGSRSDDEEDKAVLAAAAVLSEAVATGTAPPCFGIRFKSFERPTRARGLQTLDLFVGAMSGAGELPEVLVLTLPKVTSVDQVTAMVWVCERLEHGYGLAPGRLRFEVQVETPQAILGAEGTALVAAMVHAGAGRVSGLHYGTYDYSAYLGIAAAYQSLEHPVADHAKAVMQLAAAGTGVRLSDGSTNVLPVGDTTEVHAAWRLHARLVRRSLERGYYQGWDMHPAHLPTRYLVTYTFFRDGLNTITGRLRAYLEQQGGAVLDEPATAVALADFLVRGLDCGAVTESEVSGLTGVDSARLAALAKRTPRSSPRQ